MNHHLWHMVGSAVSTARVAPVVFVPDEGTTWTTIQASYGGQVKATCEDVGALIYTTYQWYNKTGLKGPTEIDQAGYNIVGDLGEDVVTFAWPPYTNRLVYIVAVAFDPLGLKDPSPPVVTSYLYL